VLSADQRSRYARHLLLVEIGEQGQARLCEARVRVASDADAGAAAVARDYLERAGVTVDDCAPGDATSLAVPSMADVDALAGRPELREAAAALAGALSAVETIKTLTGAGTPAAMPDALRLIAGEDD